MADTWEALKQDCMACHGCALADTRTNVVFGDGAEDAEIMLIGEGPGQHEDEQGIPFVGRAGQLLDDMLEIIGLDRTKVYIANVVKCRPPGNRNPMPDECTPCLGYLQRQIALVQPRVIVLLGNIALTALFGRGGITQARGNWREYQGVPVMPTFHPAFLLRHEKYPRDFIDLKRKVWNDLQLVMAKLKETEPGRP